MTADEIRKRKPRVDALGLITKEDAIIFGSSMLKEIAAQLAELNEHFTTGVFSIDSNSPLKVRIEQ